MGLDPQTIITNLFIASGIVIGAFLTPLIFAFVGFAIGYPLLKGLRFLNWLHKKYVGESFW